MWTLLAIFALATGAMARKQFIVNGDDVDIADYPWQGSYRTGANSHSCGCVSVGGEWVLTAGHCGGSSAYSMEFGGTNRGSGTVFDVSAVTRHPDYGVGPGFTPNDIAVVEATSAISGSDISPASLPANDNNPGGDGWITGWGRTCGSCALPLTLQGIEVTINTDAYCTGIYGNDFQPSSMICVGGEGAGGSCNGDSGGPMSQGSTVYGVTSWGIVGCPDTFPSVYCRVGAFTEWICEETGNGAEGC